MSAFGGTIDDRLFLVCFPSVDKRISRRLIHHLIARESLDLDGLVAQGFIRV